MPAEVILVGKSGRFKGKMFRFKDRDTCVIGRGKDCSPQLPDDEEHQYVSRHHCLMDVNPPDIRVRDFGSLNGTFVNGEKIGQRRKGQSPEEGRTQTFNEYELCNKDLVQIGATVFEVQVIAPMFCSTCLSEIPEEDEVESKLDEGVFICKDCVEATKKGMGPTVLARDKPQCVGCGADVGAEIRPNWHGEFLCGNCRTDPGRIVERILSGAQDPENPLHEICDYVIEKELGHGGMAVVYLAVHEKSGDKVALKVMLPQVATDEASTEMFLRETRNTRALDHPNVVHVTDSGYSNGVFFLCLEYCNAGTVDERLEQKGGTLPLDVTLSIILQVLDGLEYAHNIVVPEVKLQDGSIREGKGLVHRDIKPRNIFLMKDGSKTVAKIGDYGLAKAFDLAGLSGQTCTGSTYGSPYFLPRQQVVNFKYAKPEVDVWATAATMYRMLTGYYPRDFPEDADPWQVVLQKDAVPIRKRDDGIPSKMAKVIDRALMDNPEIGYKSAAAFKKALLKAAKKAG